ncbi:MAG: DUF933 domain-containing protein, partial [Pirellulaceae bacterium]
KAEVVHFKDLVEFGSMQAAKENGKVRMEGKDYVSRQGIQARIANRTGLSIAS